VGGDRQEVHAQVIRPEGDFPERLDGVGMDEGALLPGDPDDIGDRLDRPDFVIRVHHRNEGGLGVTADRRASRSIVPVESTGTYVTLPPLRSR